MTLPVVRIIGDDDTNRKLNIMMKTEARHRGMILSYVESTTFILALFSSSTKSIDKDALKEKFKKYYPQGLSGNVSMFRDLKPKIEGKLSKIVESGYTFDEIMKQLDDVCEERNKMAHATSNRFQHIMDKDISILQTTSYYIYSSKEINEPVEIFEKTDKDCEAMLGQMSQLLEKLSKLQLYINPNADTSGIGEILGIP